MWTLFSCLPWPLHLVAVLVLLVVVALIAVALARTELRPRIEIDELERSFLDPVSGQRLAFPSLFQLAQVKLSVVIPAFNEARRLPVMLKECVDYLENSYQPSSYEIIVVDDGSSDDTTPVAQQWTKQLGPDKFRVLTLQRNLGKGGAVRRGVLVARGEKILFADADGATTFSELAKLEAQLPDYGIVCGSRAHLEEQSIASRSVFRTVLMYGFHACVWLFGCRQIKDTQCGFKLLTKTAAINTFPSLHIERWAFDVELLKIAELQSIPLLEVPVQWKEVDGSKLNPLLASIQMFCDLFMLWLRYALGLWCVEKTQKTE